MQSCAIAAASLQDVKHFQDTNDHKKKLCIIKFAFSTKATQFTKKM